MCPFRVISGRDWMVCEWFVDYNYVWQISQYPWRRMYRRSLTWTQAFCTFRQLVWLFTSFADLECSAAGPTSADRLMLWLWFLKVYFFCFWYQRKSICNPSSWCFLTCSGFPLFFWAQSDSRVTAVCFKVLFQEPCPLCVLYSKSILSHGFVVVLLCVTSSQSMFTRLLQSPTPAVSSLKVVHLKSRSGSDNDFRVMLSNYVNHMLEFI